MPMKAAFVFVGHCAEGTGQSLENVRAETYVAPVDMLHVWVALVRFHASLPPVIAIDPEIVSGSIERPGMLEGLHTGPATSAIDSFQF